LKPRLPSCAAWLCPGLSDRAAAARQRLLQHQQAQALSQAPSLSGLFNGSQQQLPGRSTQGYGSSNASEDEQKVPLAVRLKLPADGAAEGSLLPVQLLRKYIAYAREHVHPVLSDEAKDILQVRSNSFACSKRGRNLRGKVRGAACLCVGHNRLLNVCSYCCA
jgi:hypothetical protein